MTLIETKTCNFKNIRAPSEVMRLEQMGCCFPTRLSFMRILMRKLINNKSNIKIHIWKMNQNGFGHAVLTIKLDGKTFSLIAFSNNLEHSMRTDRVIASAWDTSFALFDGVPSNDDIDRLKGQLPLQEAGRYSNSEIVISRANKSVRIFNSVVDCLSKGLQPPEELINKIGYLMRTTAVYGNGKFGICDRNKIKSFPIFSPPFQAEMLTVYLIRHFSIELVHHIAQNVNSKKFVFLDKKIQRHIGIGNATGLGMAPFLINHPVLLNNWLMVKETALSRLLAKEEINKIDKNKVISLIDRALNHLNEWITDDRRQKDRILTTIKEWTILKSKIDINTLSKLFPLQVLLDLTKDNSKECQELMISLILEIGSNEIDGLENCLESSLCVKLVPEMKLADLKNIIENNFHWTFEINFELKTSNSKFWYVSEEKLEPRLGNRFSETGSELEQPLDIAKQIQNLYKDINNFSDKICVAEFLMKHPNHRYIVKRVQTNVWAPYSEIQSNLIGKNCLPIDMLRFKLSFFGASKFDPKSDKWTRVNLYQGAPLGDELHSLEKDDWWLKPMNCNL